MIKKKFELSIDQSKCFVIIIDNFSIKGAGLFCLKFSLALRQDNHGHNDIRHIRFQFTHSCSFNYVNDMG